MLLAGLANLTRAARAFAPDTRRFLAGMFLMGIGHGAVWVHLNLYLRALGWGETEIGAVLSAGSMGIVAVAIPAARWVDRFPSGRIFALSATGFSLSFVLMALCPVPGVVIPLAFFNGVLFTVHWVAEGPFFMRTEGPAHRTELFGIAAGLESAAVVVSAWGTGLLAAWLGRLRGSEVAGLRAALVVAAGVSAIAILPYVRVRSVPPAAAPRPWREYLLARDMGLILRLSLPGFLVGCGAGLTIPFLNLYFRDRFGRDPASVGRIFAAAQVLTTAGFLLGPMLARRFTHVRAVVATELLSIPFFFLLAVTDRLWVAVGAFWMRGALMNMNQPVSQAFAMEVVAPDQQAVANAYRHLAWNSAWMVSTMTGGWLIEHHGFAPGMFATMGLYLLAATLFWTFFRGRVV